MGVLRNSKHEVFAQALATGKSATEAYALAGYRRNRGNAAALKANQSISKRVQELQAAVAEKVILNETMVLSKIAEILEAKPENPPTYRDQVAAIGQAVKILGMEKTEQNVGVGISIRLYEAELNI